MGPDDEGDITDARRSWEVGGNRIELSRTGTDCWTARVHRDDWNGTPLEVDGVFTTEVEAIAWCERMIAVFKRDMADEKRVE